MPFDSLPNHNLQFPELKPFVVPPKPVWDTGPLLSLLSKNIEASSPYNQELRKATLENLQAQRQERIDMGIAAKNRSEADRDRSRAMLKKADQVRKGMAGFTYVAHGAVGQPLASGKNTDANNDTPLPTPDLPQVTEDTSTTAPDSSTTAPPE